MLCTSCSTENAYDAKLCRTCSRVLQEGAGATERSPQMRAPAQPEMTTASPEAATAGEVKATAKTALKWGVLLALLIGLASGGGYYGYILYSNEQQAAQTEAAKGVLATAQPPATGQARGTAAGDQRGSAAGTVYRDCDECPEMVVIAAGTFLMGSKADPVADSTPADEQPQHTVSIKSFSLGRFEVTQAQWQAVMGTLPSRFEGRTLPVEQVSWDDAQAFVSKLSEKTGKKYRLPSEAEWEYAARAGSQTNYSFGDKENELRRYAWFIGNAGHKTHPVGEKVANAFGLHDMHGNVWEWTEDCWNSNYAGAPGDGSAWTAGNCSLRVVRGGSWGSSSRFLRSAFRYGGTTARRYSNDGFRVARTD